jgi:hypothetical protein
MANFTSLLRARFEGFCRKKLALVMIATSSRFVRRAFLFAVFVAALVNASAGCLANRSSTDKLLDAAHEHNGAVRFGRMDIALDHVAASTKGEWLRRRAGWKNNVRIIDVELEGMVLEANTVANVQVRVAWQRIDEADLRSTEVVQKWQAKDGPWQLVSEDCTGGDTSLLAVPETGKPETGKP